VQCDQNPHPGCELGAGSGGKHSTPSRGSGGTSSGNGSTGGSGSSGGSGREETKNPNPDLNLADCSYQRSDYTSPPGVVQTAYVTPSKGGVAVAQPAVYSSAAPSTVVPAAEPDEGCAGRGDPLGQAKRSRSACDPELAVRLWEWSERQTGVSYNFNVG
jgi:hypothetical protein